MMNDEDWKTLQLETRIAPSSTRWPDPSTAWHWRRIHEAADAARAAVKSAWSENDKIERNPDLTMQAKRKRRAEAAMAAVAALEGSKALFNAKTSVERQMKAWASKAAEVIKKPEDAHEVAMYQEVRALVRGLSDDKRLHWVSRHASDPTVFSALLTAPPFLSGLGKAEFLEIVNAATKAAADTSLGPEIAESKVATEKAMAAVEAGWKTASRLIAEKGGLRQIGERWEAPPEAA